MLALGVHPRPLDGEIVRSRYGQFREQRLRVFLLGWDFFLGSHRFAGGQDLQIQTQFLMGALDQFLNDLLLVSLGRLRQPDPQRPPPDQHARQAIQGGLLIHAAFEHAVEHILGRNDAGNFPQPFGRISVSVSVRRLGGAFQLGLEHLKPRIGQGTAVPTDEQAFFPRKVFVRPLQNLGLGIIFGQPVFHPVFQMDVFARPDRERREKRHPHQDPQPVPVAPDISFFKKVWHFRWYRRKTQKI